jgi:predicted RNA-binding protein YlxR (DUF448 family)
MTKPKRQRTCRACREKKDKYELLRMVILNSKHMEVDYKHIMPGRGWYLCRKEACLAVLKNPKGRKKAFGQGIDLSPGLNKLLTNPPAGGVHGQN